MSVTAFAPALADASMWQPLLVSISQFLYAVHMASVPLWFQVCASEWLRQRRKGLQPTEWEFFGLRLFAVYAVMDALRNADSCIDSEDGVCRSVWGTVPHGLRFFFWWVRDVASFAGVVKLLEFEMGWTHAVLGSDMPRGLKMTVRLATLSASVGMATCFIALSLTNRQSWQIATAFSVVPMNVALAEVNRRMLSKVLPSVNKLATCSDDSMIISLVGKTRVKLQLMLILNVTFACVFPLICAFKILGGAHSQRLVPGVELGFPIIDARPPLLVHIAYEAPTVLPIPLLEVLELSMGWMNLVICVLTSRGFPVNEKQPDSQFIAAEAIGEHVRRRMSSSVGATHHKRE